MKKILVGSWKTTLIGLALIAAVIMYLFSKISTEQFLTVTTFLTGVGLVASKDWNKKDIQSEIGGSQIPPEKDEK